MQARKLINKQCNKKLGPSSGRNLEVDQVWGAFIQIGPSCGKKCKFLSIYVLKLDQFVKKKPANWQSWGAGLSWESFIYSIIDKKYLNK